MAVSLEFHEAVPSDFVDLASARLRERALELLDALTASPLIGKALGDHPGVGDLTGYRALYFAESKSESPSHRIVYRVFPSDAKPERVLVVSIGKREAFRAYREARRRIP